MYPSDLTDPAAIFVDRAGAMGPSGSFAGLGARLSGRLDDAEGDVDDAHRLARLCGPHRSGDGIGRLTDAISGHSANGQPEPFGRCCSYFPE